MKQAITQSLAERVGILTLLTFSIHELMRHNVRLDSAFDYVIKGS